jgi:hypothetical protein
MEHADNVLVVRPSGLRYRDAHGVTHAPTHEVDGHFYDAPCRLTLSFGEYWDRQPTWPITCIVCAAR